MTLGELIGCLEKCLIGFGNIVCLQGFYNPHSYRGSYDELAFEPTVNVELFQMLDSAKSAVGSTFLGYKGGHYTMDLDTPVIIANYSNIGNELDPSTLGEIIFDPRNEPAPMRIKSSLDKLAAQKLAYQHPEDYTFQQGQDGSWRLLDFLRGSEIESGEF